MAVTEETQRQLYHGLEARLGKEVAGGLMDHLPLPPDGGWANVATKQNVAALKGDVAAVKDDVAAVKQDVAAVKGDVVAIKQDVAEMRGRFTLVDGRFKLIDQQFEVLGLKIDNGLSNVANELAKFGALADAAVANSRIDLMQKHLRYVNAALTVIAVVGAAVAALLALH